MIRFRNDKILPSVVISTAMGHDGTGIMPYKIMPDYQDLLLTLKRTGTPVFTKSHTFDPHVGNVVWPYLWTYYQYIRRIKNRGMVNAYGLTNPGVVVCAKNVDVTISHGMNIKPNFYPQFKLNNVDRTEQAIIDTLKAIEIYIHYLGKKFWMIELNFSCPNSADDISRNMTQVLRCLKAVRTHFPWLIVVAKMSYVQPTELFQEIEHQKLADAFHRFNTIDYTLVFGKPSPLKNKAGGASGGPIRELCFKRNEEISKATSLPSIMGGGIPALLVDSPQRYFDIGADAVSYCTEVAYLPLAVKEVILKYAA